MGGHLIKDEIIYNTDMINLVLENINYGSVWKSIRSLSKNIYYLSRKYQRSKLIELGNPILSLIYIYPGEDWRLLYLSLKDIITIDLIKLTHDKIPWTKKMISRSINITIDDILKSDPDSIDWEEISMNPSIKVSDMLNNDYLPWDYNAASRNTSIRIEDIRNNLGKNWDYSELALNSALSIEDLFTIINLSDDSYWWENENATYEDIIKYSNVNILHSYNHCIAIMWIFPLEEDVLQKYINKYSIESHQINTQSITPNIIKNNPQLNWDFVKIDYSKFTVKEVVDIPVTDNLDVYRILDHPDFTIDDFFKYFDINIFDKWFILSISHWVTFDIVLKYKDIIRWLNSGLSANPNVTVDILEDSDFSWIRWYYSRLSRHAQLNWVYIIEHIDKDWDINNLTYNKSLIR